MGRFAHVERKHQYIAACTRTTSTLYWYYKHFVLALQSACSVCTNNFSLHCKCCCVDTLMAKWGMQTAF